MVATPLTNRYVALASKALGESDRPILEGEPIIMETEVPVRDVVALWQDVRPEDIPVLLYELVSAAQVFDALSFYFDNRVEMEGYLQRYRELGLLNRSAIVLSHSPFWGELEANIADEREALDAEPSNVESESGQAIA